MRRISNAAYCTPMQDIVHIMNMDDLYIAMMDEEYKDTYGDVNVEVVFGTAYDPQKAMVILAGFANEDDPHAPFAEWYVLRAEALEPKNGQEKSDSVEIGLKQLFLPWMEEKPLMLVVISEVLDAE